ncbi:MAG: putative transmembrane protein [Oceanicaulis sp. HLUCCA04]|nr:MAG: putative transmembrane protein [Oceanicaulis sp. HLUCCA04]
MMRVLALTAMALAGTAHAAPEDEIQPVGIVAALTQEVVEIRSNFTGADFLVYGAVTGLEEEDDIVVVVRGPQEDLRVMRKIRTLGIWMNRAPIAFEDIYGYYAVASTQALSQFATFSSLRREGIGMEHIRLSAPDHEREETRFGVDGVVVTELGAEIVDYRRAVVRNRAREGLYVESPGGVEILDGGLFRAGVRLPPVTPVGEYALDIYLFRDGVPIASRRTTLQVRKAGFEQAIYDFAHERAPLYGMIAVIIALIAGWSAAEIFRRR